MPQHASSQQRNLIRHLHQAHAGDEIRVCDAYARAEERGFVFRARGDYRLSSHDYARAVLLHGRERGWLKS